MATLQKVALYQVDSVSGLCTGNTMFQLTGTVSAKFFTVNFISDGTNWWETSRTAVQS